MKDRIKVGIIGATSFTSTKLVELLLGHPNAEIVYLSSDSNAGEPAQSAHSILKHLKVDLKFEATDFDKAGEICDLVFITKPHGYFHKEAENLYKHDVKIIDFGGDFRLKNPELYAKWYGFDHNNIDLLEKSVYGLCELYKNDIAQAKLIANPGCYPTSVILGLIPALGQNDLVDLKSISVNSISGVSGAGRKLTPGNMFINVAENVTPYKIGTHQHTPEMEEILFKKTGKKVNLLFAPQVGPFKIGILSNIFFSLVSDKYTADDIYQLYIGYYKDNPFMRIYKPGELPQVINVLNTNFCDIGITIDKRTNKCVITSAIDNIMKGASGQAVQNMNIAFGLKETTGLPYGEIL